LDFDDGSNVNEAEEDTNKKEDSATIKYLRNQKARTIDQVKNDGQRYIIHKKDDGTTEILTKDFKERERRPISRDEIEDIIVRKNTVKEKKPVVYTFNDTNELLKNGKKIPKSSKKKFIQELNKAAELIHGEGNVHYRWEFDENDEFKNTILVNTTKWDDTDKLDNNRFDAAEYKKVETQEDKDALISLLAKVVKNATSKKKKNVIGYDYELNTFTSDGKPMTDDELKKFITGINGGIKDSSDAEYWSKFKISMKGSKVGDIANFSLPPVETCNRESPCITDGCYAIKAYGMYPSSRVAMDVNLALLRQGGKMFEKLRSQLKEALSSKFKKSVGAIEEGKVIKYFRFHVSGDIFSPEYLDLMCTIAKENKHVGFWTYTKQYAILANYHKTIPDNLSIIVSCWGDFRPKLYKGGKYADLEKQYPLAFLDDGSEKMKNYIDTKDGKGKPFICPCTDYSESEVHCNTCLRCYETKSKTKDGEGIMVRNLIFRKH
jgi:predicted transcriptional regulator YdeE